jgi:hypothetical protein
MASKRRSTANKLESGVWFTSTTRKIARSSPEYVATAYQEGQEKGALFVLISYLNRCQQGKASPKSHWYVFRAHDWQPGSNRRAEGLLSGLEVPVKRDFR